MSSVERWEPSDRQFAMIERQAKVLAKSGLVPTNNPDAATYAMLRAIGVGVDPLQTFEHFHVFNTGRGWRLTCSAQLLAGLARSAGCRFEWQRSDDKAATVTLTRPGHPPTTLTYTLEQAKKAKLDHKDNWKYHTADMLRAAVLRKIVRMAAPDVLLGLPPSVDTDADFDGEIDGEDAAASPGAPVPAQAASSPPLAPPVPPLTDDQRDALRQALERLTDYERAAVRTQAKADQLAPLAQADMSDGLAYWALIGRVQQLPAPEPDITPGAAEAIVALMEADAQLRGDTDDERPF